MGLNEMDGRPNPRAATEELMLGAAAAMVAGVVVWEVLKAALIRGQWAWALILVGAVALVVVLDRLGRARA